MRGRRMGILRRWVWAALLTAAAGALAVGTARADGDCVGGGSGGNCAPNPQISTGEITWGGEGATARGGRWRCEGLTTIGVLVPVSEDTCYPMIAYVDCNGQIVRYESTGYHGYVPPCGVVGAWKRYCEPTSGFQTNGGFCEWRDYYGQWIRLRVEVPIHQFRITPYPLALVAREDPLGEFHPSARLEWLPPPFPSHDDSGWRLWTWGDSRGPGSAPVFPCGMSEADLLANNVPAGTTCVRLQLWTAPDFRPGDLQPVMAPGVLQFPAIRLNRAIWPNERVDLNFPYASHPATGQTDMVPIFGQKVPAFPGYFQRWWPVRFRVEVKRVKDITGTVVHCDPVGSGETGDCWVTVNGRLVAGRSWTETVVERKEWEIELRDGILDLRGLGRPYAYLHPDRLRIIGPDRTWLAGYVLRPPEARNPTPWLYCPLAVREAQGVVCANPGCTGEEPPDIP